ncbi:dicarboxylate/amino acid:cation symporter [Spiroplasma endosymbiont of Labia minor]|uniref:dicarboxylate/amino acid:cation symporter n=1 Tax=Spiroplasma endosymbiont of Labia minor TaxID=3066305 RepID=UPI0030CAC234
MVFLASTNEILKNFLAISTWQSLVAIVLFLGITVGFWYFLKYIKIKFIYRVLIGFVIGLVFGVVVQAIIDFPSGNFFDPTIADPDNLGEFIDNPNYLLWVGEFSTWAQLLKQVFINGIMLITIPVVFLSITRIVAKPSKSNLGRITAKGVSMMLFNVAIAFIITFWIGYSILKNNSFMLDLSTASGDTNAAHETQPLPEIIFSYVPSNYVGVFTATAIIPAMVLGLLTGTGIKLGLKKRHEEAYQKTIAGLDRAWDVVLSILMVFTRIMPLAIMSMITVAITTRPIGALSSIGIILGIGYLCILIMFVILTVILIIYGVNPKVWWKQTWRALIQGFATQSSNATLPTTMEVLKDELHVKESVVSVVTPLSTSMGLMGCAGVQSGLITSFLFTAHDINENPIVSMALIPFFILALFVTIVASLGIAGIPGTATVVTSGVLGGLGYGTLFGPVYAIIGALDGLFDMGRTGLNVIAGAAVTTQVAKIEGQIDNNQLILGKISLLNGDQKNDIEKYLQNLNLNAQKETKLNYADRTKIKIELKNKIKATKLNIKNAIVEYDEKYKIVIKDNKLVQQKYNQSLKELKKSITDKTELKMNKIKLSQDVSLEYSKNIETLRNKISAKIEALQ